MIKLLDILHEIQIFPYEYVNDSKGKVYYFSTDSWDYQVNIIHNDYESSFPYLNFKAKKIGESNFSFDTDIVTNDNMYSVIGTIKSILEKDIQTSSYEGYTFSTAQNKKGNQRINLYKRIIPPNWNIVQTDIPNRIKIIP